ncbi:hypothetical protein BpHYR1_002373 [Brachionus plicatilis]|uniref:Uncharacterized protein n=1 Tax=Brachionus plicatilis TaxID=10195 RepID=A0A3M7Q7Y0_BRAPC|nr:hypothetical protein BpHYR1_002373 [Brachionus plicatilis]
MPKKSKYNQSRVSNLGVFGHLSTVNISSSGKKSSFSDNEKNIDPIVVAKKRGRPAGSKNKPKDQSTGKQLNYYSTKNKTQIKLAFLVNVFIV